jgi:hypothetical protein
MNSRPDRHPPGIFWRDPDGQASSQVEKSQPRQAARQQQGPPVEAQRYSHLKSAVRYVIAPPDGRCQSLLLVARTNRFVSAAADLNEHFEAVLRSACLRNE